MYAKQDQTGLARAYSLIAEMHNTLGMPSPQGGIPVMVTMDMPGAEVHDHSHDHYNHSDSEDGEMEMAVSELHRISDQALKLKDLLSDMSSLEGWTASKITKAADYISSVYNYLNYSQEQGDVGCSCSDQHSMHGAGYEDTCSCEHAARGCKCGGCSDCN